MHTVHEVQENSDHTEGRGPWVRVCTFINKDDALAFVLSQKGHFGRPIQNDNGTFNGWAIVPVEVLDSLEESDYDKERHQRNLLVVQARAKLTPEELEALLNPS